MKKLLFCLILASSITTSFAQETKSTENKPERIKIVKGGVPEPAQTSNSTVKQSPAEELKSCEALLAAINKKEAYLKANPEEFKVAEESGWFKDVEKTKAILMNRMNELKIELKK